MLLQAQLRDNSSYIFSRAVLETFLQGSMANTQLDTWIFEVLQDALSCDAAKVGCSLNMDRDHFVHERIIVLTIEAYSKHVVD